MTLNLTVTQQAHADFKPRITVFGVGGGGINAVNNMINLNLQGVEFVVANTDAQHLNFSRAERKIQLGPHITQGTGAGGRPDVGKAAAEEAAEEIARNLENCHIVFITAGMGGGTGTGASPVVARLARERNILTIGVVTKPFAFEGPARARAADAGVKELQKYVDTLITIPNQNLFRVSNAQTGWKEAFQMIDNVLYSGVRSVTDLMYFPGFVNLDFADVRSVMAEMGKAMMGTGEGEGENRALKAAEAAISNPLLESTSMAGAKALLINISGGSDLKIHEVDQAANRVREEVDPEANIIFGSVFDETLEGRVRVSVVAAGITDKEVESHPAPNVRSASSPAPVSSTQNTQGANEPEAFYYADNKESYAPGETSFEQESISYFKQAAAVAVSAPSFERRPVLQQNFTEEVSPVSKQQHAAPARDLGNSQFNASQQLESDKEQAYMATKQFQKHKTVPLKQEPQGSIFERMTEVLRPKKKQGQEGGLFSMQSGQRERDMPQRHEPLRNEELNYASGNNDQTQKAIPLRSEADENNKSFEDIDLEIPTFLRC